MTRVQEHWEGGLGLVHAPSLAVDDDCPFTLR